MLGFSRFQRAFWSGITALFFLLSVPAFLSQTTRDSLPGFLSRIALVFGLDLKGGVQILLEVDTEKLAEDHYAFCVSSVRSALRKSGVKYRLLTSDKAGIYLVTQAPASSYVPLIESSLGQKLHVQVSENQTKLSFHASALKTILIQARDKSIETIRRRVDATGTKEPVIQAQGEARVLLEVPGSDDSGRVRDLVGRTARLTFHLVDDIFSLGQKRSFEVAPDQEVLLAQEDGKEKEGDETNSGFAYVVNKEVLLSGDMLLDARPTFDDFNRVQVAFVFNGIGAELFGSLTQAHTGRLFAVVLDGRVLSAPKIKEPIMGGRGVIQGSFSVREAEDLSLLMRSGSLPAPLNVLEERVIGPGLGADSVRLGVWATFMAVCVVVGVMIFAYGRFSLFSNIALILNLILLLGAMSWFGMTLTLPGIAGIALTLGMAVDANVLINERIKEELRLGRVLMRAVDSGYTRAMNTILDSNITTLIGGMILYSFGTGSVKGFAVTLCLGILISMFTAVLFSKVLVSYWFVWFKPKKIFI